MADEVKNARIINELREWGCDIEGAMDRFMNDQGLYCTIFLNRPLLRSWGAAIEAKDTKASFEKAHELKGVLANMGLSPMYTVTCNMVEPLRAGKMIGVEDNYAILMGDLEKLKKIING